MSSTPCTTSAKGNWIFEWMGIAPPQEGARLEIKGQPFIYHEGVLRAEVHYSESQSQTSECFGFKWQKRDTFEGGAVLNKAHEWLVNRYGNVENAPWWSEMGESPILLDAGCGAGMSALELFIWAKRQYALMPRCSRCGDPYRSDEGRTIFESFDDEEFCSDYCAETAHFQNLRVQEEEQS